MTLPEAVRGDSQELAAKAVQVGGVQHRAKRRAGQLLTEMKQSGERQNQGDHRKTSNGAASKATLSDLGVTRDQSSKWQQLAVDARARY